MSEQERREDGGVGRREGEDGRESAKGARVCVCTYMSMLDVY